VMVPMDCLQLQLAAASDDTKSTEHARNPRGTRRKAAGRLCWLPALQFHHLLEFRSVARLSTFRRRCRENEQVGRCSISAAICVANANLGLRGPCCEDGRDETTGEKEYRPGMVLTR
jgi:hypothetical protein